MNSRRQFIAICTWACCQCAGALWASALLAAEPTAEQLDFFERRVRPVLVSRCQECHGEDNSESELRLDTLAGLLAGGTRGPAIVVGDPKASLLVSAINHSDQLHMPPKEKLPRNEIADIAEWIRAGAAWPDAIAVAVPQRPHQSAREFTADEKSFWAFQRPVKHAPPQVRNQAWVRSPIDAFVLSRLEEKGLSPAPPADRRTLIRRITFDLIGLPPTPEEVRAYLADESSEATARLIDRLLASPQYGERWGRRWLDVARYADSNGLDENLAFANAFRYRDYVVAALNRDKPFDRFLQEQIAGDLLTDGADFAVQSEGITATALLSIGAKMLAEDDPVKMQMDIVDEQVDLVGRAFLGLTLGCARCHDHKFDPISTQDYYALAGIFASTKTMDNFSVVARWQERPLATPEQLAEQAAHRKAVADKKAEIDSLVRKAGEALLADARRHVGLYLVAAENHRRAEASLKQIAASLPKPGAEKSPGTIALQAEEYVRGNVVKDFSAYGQGIGVVYNSGQYPNFAEYDFELPAAGHYVVQIRYAAAARRAVKLFVNGELLKAEAAGEVTGGWHPESQAWHVEGVYSLPAGKNTLRLERAEPFPHFDELRIVPAVSKEMPPLALPEHATASPPKQPLVIQLAEHLARATDDRQSPLAAWQRFIATGTAPTDLPPSFATDYLLAEPLPATLLELAARYERLCAEIDAEWQAFRASEAGRNATALPDPKREAVRQLLYDAKGPFALPKDAETSYDAATRDDLARRREEVKKLEAAAPKLNEVMAVSEDKPRDLRVHIRGSHVTLGEPTQRGFPRIFAATGGDASSAEAIDGAQSGRLQLARWLTSGDNPLTARVMVNRVWQGHFGEGLVRSPDNFGRLGELPSHPELLDWLAVEFVEQGWSLKKLHRAIMHSSTYQMSTAHQTAAAEIDPENRLLWRMNRRRLEAEALRDSILAVAGSLDFAMGGSLLPTENRKYVTSTANVDPVVYESARRSIYLPVVRSALYGVFQAFDFAEPSVSNSKRATTTVAPQALFMMNGDLVLKQTSEWSGRLLADAAIDDAGRVTQVYERAYARLPSTGEQARATAYIADYAKGLMDTGKPADEARRKAWQSFCRAVIAANEFIFVE